MARFINPPGSGGDADIADFLFTNEGDEESSTITISNKDMNFQTLRDEEGTDADINLDSADDIFITANGDDVVIFAQDEVRIDANDNIEIVSGDSLILSGDGGEFLGPSDPENQIATLGDIGIETSYSVQGGTDGTQPTFTGDPLFSASYIRMSSNLVHFQIQVDMDNITSFGTGQYAMTVPFISKYGYKFRDGCLHDIDAGRTYHISGHVYANSNVLELFSTDVSGQNLFDFPFAQGEPITLTTADNFHISGTYIAEDLV
jgi:hypothetical protein